uniref:Uncharacterized protein n=1 Tax=Cacopsylla melanoneura TaxID=428564 RepID=A0A8D8XEC1_9HEMI
MTFSSSSTLTFYSPRTPWSAFVRTHCACARSTSPLCSASMIRPWCIAGKPPLIISELVRRPGIGGLLDTGLRPAISRTLTRWEGSTPPFPDGVKKTSTCLTNSFEAVPRRLNQTIHPP